MEHVSRQKAAPVMHDDMADDQAELFQATFLKILFLPCCMILNLSGGMRMMHQDQAHNFSRACHVD